jgi:hypothetical protein
MRFFPHFGNSLQYRACVNAFFSDQLLFKAHQDEGQLDAGLFCFHFKFIDSIQ